MDVRAPMEELAARLAARRSGPELTAQLEENFAAFIQANKSSDRQSLIRLDEQFHMTIFKATWQCASADDWQNADRGF